VNIFLSGYYGYANAGDEAVLASIIEHLASEAPARISSLPVQDRHFTVTAGDVAQAQALHGPHSERAGWKLSCIARQAPRALAQGIRSCDLFISGGGSLLQDVTSVRNIVYYTGLIRFARLARKPVMIYAQGVGPLRQSISRKLARAALQNASAITVRDEASRDLLAQIGVRREVQVTADPVWALPSLPTSAPNLQGQTGKTWMVSLRSWTEGGRGFGSALAQAARAQGARLQFLPMQPQHDGPLIRKYLQEHAGALGAPDGSEVLDTQGRHPSEIVAMTAGAHVMIAMRLHALIFAASRGVPCVAVNYDPKVEALARIMGAPCLDDLNDPVALQKAIADARPLGPERLQVLAEAARSNARVAWSLV
jgi:polysaccharide pyruvyl transferase CsaB